MSCQIEEYLIKSHVAVKYAQEGGKPITLWDYCTVISSIFSEPQCQLLRPNSTAAKEQQFTRTLAETLLRQTEMSCSCSYREIDSDTYSPARLM